MFLRKPLVEGDRQDIIVLENKDNRVVGLYRGFKNIIPERDPLSSFFEALQQSCVTPKNLTIVGDFNIDPIRDKETRRGRLLDTLLINNSLLQLMSEVTRRRMVLKDNIQHLEESTLDLVLTSDDRVVASAESSYNSDHLLIMVNLPNKNPALTRKVEIKDWTRLSNRVITSEWEKIKKDPMTLEEMNDAHVGIVEHIAPVRSIRIRYDNQMINLRIEKVKKKRDRVYSKWKKTTTLQHKAALAAKLKDLNFQVGRK